ncbi:hypothetical protein AAZX31_18G116600 [Glycine max]|nr:hypothetical protein JHK87_049787 [Glycine soja]KAG4935843.1 hypothetical protein JHK85_050762 [Glycine max]KAG5091334.1 hypothetical protein JHK82_050112 [Glycine max]KAH1197918.1 Single-stranded DNA-binding protein WHY1, chloroplastic [Glycine max]
MSNLQLQIHSPPPSLLSYSSSSLSSSSSLKLFPNHPFSSKSLPFNTPKPFSLRCRHSDLFDQNTLASTPRPTRPSASVGALPPRVYVGYSIYKGKAALTLTPRPPEFMPLDSGAYKISKEGYVLLQFAPAVGTRQYDWNRKQVFSLSVGEMGSVISLGARDSYEFFHDPFKGKSDEGKVRKILKVEPLPDGSGHFFNLSVQNKLVNVDESIYIPVTKAELAVLTSTFNFIMPYLLGWHTFANSIKPEDNGVNDANPRYGGDYEWNR